MSAGHLQQTSPSPCVCCILPPSLRLPSSLRWSRCAARLPARASEGEYFIANRDTLLLTWDATKLQRFLACEEGISQKMRGLVANSIVSNVAQMKKSMVPHSLLMPRIATPLHQCPMLLRCLAGVQRS